MTAMQVRPVVDALTAQQAELAGLLEGRSSEEWAKPTPCEGWSVADVVLHLAQTDELAIASLEGRLPAVGEELGWSTERGRDVDDAADALVVANRDQAPEEIAAQWKDAAARLIAAFREADPHARVQWVAGELSVRTLTTTRLAETWIHTGDVATAFGVELEPTDCLWDIARLAWRTLPYAFARAGRELHGPVRFSLDAPAEGVWDFVPDAEPATTVYGPVLDLCLVAARRRDPSDAALRAEGVDADAVLELVRTYA